MNTRQRILSVLNFEMPTDRLPMVEWGHWWDKTHHRWQKEGLPPHLTGDDLFDYFGLDHFECLFVRLVDKGCPGPAYHGAPVITNEASYEAIRPFLFTDNMLDQVVQGAKALKDAQARGDIAVRVWLDGFFWFPRTLFGIENHLFAFYDEPDLMHRINQELLAFNLRALEAVLNILTPDMVSIAEDMSYNNGPMLSKDMYDQFIAPYYAKYMPLLKSQNIKVLVDTDGDLAPMVPWLIASGIDGIFPLERQAGVDVVQLRKDYPQLIMMGAYDKMVMSKGEAAMRAEFERLLPVMRTGGFMPATDHQVPPEVSLENYRIYMRLYKEYCTKGTAD